MITIYRRNSFGLSKLLGGLLFDIPSSETFCFGLFELVSFSLSLFLYSPSKFNVRTQTRIKTIKKKIEPLARLMFEIRP